MSDDAKSAAKGLWRELNNHGISSLCVLGMVCGMYCFSSHNHTREQSSNEMGQIDNSGVNEFVCFIKWTRHSLSVNCEIRSYCSSHCIQNFWHSDFGAPFCRDKQHFLPHFLFSRRKVGTIWMSSGSKIRLVSQRCSEHLEVNGWLLLGRTPMKVTS